APAVPPPQPRIPPDRNRIRPSCEGGLGVRRFRFAWTPLLRIPAARLPQSRVTEFVPGAAAALGLALVLALVAPSRADEAALRADAEKTFKEQVGPFVKKYCVSCHGSRPEAGVNLQSALNDPGTT